MQGILRTSDLVERKNVPGEIIAVTRVKPFGIRHWIPDLAPSKETFWWYLSHRDDESWFPEYKARYIEDMRHSVVAKERFIEILEDLRAGVDVTLVCYCKDPELCHRSLLAHWVELHGFEVRVG